MRPSEMLAVNFNPRSLTGATCVGHIDKHHCRNFNPRSLTGATMHNISAHLLISISIHAPSRERLYNNLMTKLNMYNFNPRSLTGATISVTGVVKYIGISIHAPSRERPCSRLNSFRLWKFQSTLPHGSDGIAAGESSFLSISIHAPSRERPANDR